jgi:hypothetical protein
MAGCEQQMNNDDSDQPFCSPCLTNQSLELKGIHNKHYCYLGSGHRHQVIAPEGGGIGLPSDELNPGPYASNSVCSDSVASEQTLRDIGSSKILNRIYDSGVATTSILPVMLSSVPYISPAGSDTRSKYTREFMLSAFSNMKATLPFVRLITTKSVFSKLKEVKSTQTAPLFVHANRGAAASQSSEPNVRLPTDAFTAYEKRFEQAPIEALRKAACNFGLSQNGSRYELIQSILRHLRSKNNT